MLVRELASQFVYLRLDETQRRIGFLDELMVSRLRSTRDEDGSGVDAGQRVQARTYVGDRGGDVVLLRVGAQA